MIQRYLVRLFTWESLENTERGVEFELKNRLIETEFAGLYSVRIDGEEVPLEDVVLELEDGTEVTPDDITEENPLEFELAETVQVVLDMDRLTLGNHEISMGFVVEGYGRVSFTTDDDVTEEDLVDANVSEMDPDEAVELAERIREPTTLREMLEDEKSGEGRDEVVDTLQGRLDEMEWVEERRERIDEGNRWDEAIEERLFRVFDSRKRLTVYTALRKLGGGDVDAVVAQTGMEPSAVEATLKNMELDGTVEYDYSNDLYTAVAPSELALERGRNLLNALRRSLE